MITAPEAPAEALKPISRDFRTGIAIATLGLEYAGFGLLTWYGIPDNTLHVSAQTGLFWGAHAILLALGVAAWAPDLIRKLPGGKP